MTGVYGVFLWKLEVWNVWEMMAVDFIAFWDSHIIYGSGISKWVGLTWLVLMSVGLWSFKKLFISFKFCLSHKTVLVSTIYCMKLWIRSLLETSILIHFRKMIKDKFCICTLKLHNRWYFSVLISSQVILSLKTIQLSHMPHFNTRGPYFESLAKG